MSKSARFILKRNDSELVSFFLKAAQIMGCESINVQIAGQESGFSISLGEGRSALAERFRSSKLKSISTISVQQGRTTLRLDRRPDQNHAERFDLAVFDPLFLEVSARYGSDSAPTLSTEVLTALNELIETSFADDIDGVSPAFRDPKTLQAVLRSHQNMIERLQDMTLQVGEQTSQARRELDAEYIELKKQLEEQVAAERLEVQKAADDERLALKQRADEIDDRARELDDRNNTHVRRELFEKTRTLLSDRFKKLDLTPQTKAARLPIHIGVATAAIILGVLIYAFTNEALAAISRVDSTVTERILTIAKSATASLAFLGIVSWYLRWMNRWFERLADSEFQLKQFELDITRAQWVVETAFEWKMSQQSPIPDQLLDNVSRNLFLHADKDDGADMHPADYLASALIGKASNVKLAVPGAEIELGPKALKDAGK